MSKLKRLLCYESQHQSQSNEKSLVQLDYEKAVSNKLGTQSTFKYVNFHVVYRANQAEYAIRILVAACQKYVNKYSKCIGICLSIYLYLYIYIYINIVRGGTVSHSRAFLVLCRRGSEAQTGRLGQPLKVLCVPK